MQKIQSFVEDELIKIKRQNIQLLEKAGQYKKSISPSLLAPKIKRQMQRQNQILLYELSIKNQMLKFLSQDESLWQPYNQSEMISRIQKISEGQISEKYLAANNTVLKKENDLLVKQKAIRLKSIKSLQEQFSKAEKSSDVYKRKCEEFDALGGRPKIQEFKRQISRKSNKIKELQQQNNLLQKHVKQLLQKIQIMQSLNNKTESQLAELLVNLGKDQNSIMAKQDRDSQKENVAKKPNIRPETAVQPIKNGKIELYSLKQQLNDERLKIKGLEKSNSALRQKLEEREIFYSKMISFR